MSSKTLVRKDGKGLFVKAGGYIARPGNVRGYDHAYRMDDAGLKEGDRVKARHRAQTPLTVITLDDGTKLHWHHEAKHIVYNYDKNITDAAMPWCERCKGYHHATAEHISEEAQAAAAQSEFTFEIRILCSVTEKGTTQADALQRIAEEFDGHLIAREISATLDSECAPVLTHINDREVPHVQIPLESPTSFNDARLHACELLLSAARKIIEAESLPDAPPVKRTATLTAEIDLCWKHCRDLLVNSDQENAT